MSNQETDIPSSREPQSLRARIVSWKALFLENLCTWIIAQSRDSKPAQTQNTPPEVPKISKNQEAQ